MDSHPVVAAAHELQPFIRQLKGKLRGVWSVQVSGNWRITFRFKNGDAFDVDYVDYH